MTVADNIEFALRVRRMKRAERVARRKELLKLVALEGLDERLPGQLSGGQQQRVAVARALVGEPALLLADEPTGNLDSVNGESIMELIEELHRAGSTICMVTHNLEFARRARRTVRLADGRIVDEHA